MRDREIGPYSGFKKNKRRERDAPDQDTGVNTKDENLYEDTDIEEPPEEGQGEYGKASQRAGAAAMQSAGPNQKKQAGAALMMTGNPYAAAAGAGLTVLGSIEEKKDAQANAEHTAKLDKDQKQLTAIQQLMQFSKTMRV